MSNQPVVNTAGKAIVFVAGIALLNALCVAVLALAMALAR